MEFDLEELQTVLKDMGYTDLPRQQLKEMAKDLKRLIKHEERRQYRDQATSSVSTSAESLEFASLKSSTATESHPPEDKEEAPKSKEKLKKQKDQIEMWKRLKSDPVRLYHWYKTAWELHNLK